MSAKNNLQQTLGEGEWAAQRDTSRNDRSMNFGVSQTPAGGDDLLAKLRCAECRQLSFEHACGVVLKFGFIFCVASAMFALINRFTKHD